MDVGTRTAPVLSPAFYDRSVLEVAPDLLGCTLHVGGVAGLIVETEAYHESEPACHAFGGIRPSTGILFEAPGNAYVYRSYGIHALVNAVCEEPGVGAAVLIRALTPVSGVETMAARRAGRTRSELTNGPGKLSQALGIGLDLNGTSLTEGPIQVRGRLEAPVIVTGPRIGITKAVDLPWRFAVAGCRDVSSPRPR